MIALGLVAGCRVAGRDPTRRSCSRSGAPLEGHDDNLAACLAGGVCLTWETPHRSDRGPTLPQPPIAVVPDAEVETAAARASLPETRLARGRRLHRRPCRAARRRARRRRPRPLRGRPRRPPARALPRRGRAAPRRAPRRTAAGRARHDDLRLRTDRDRLGARGRRRRLRGRAHRSLPGRAGAAARTSRRAARDRRLNPACQPRICATVRVPLVARLLHSR